MNIWIEISSEYRFQNKLEGKSGLYAPATNRYFKMLKGVEIGDVVLHYIVASAAFKVEHRSKILGISKVKSKMYQTNTKITADLERLKKMKIPISLKEIKSMEYKSDLLINLISYNFQRYLARITKKDLDNILKIHNGNYPLMQHYS